jgi:deoxyribodipyrimidine photo-lyase
LTLIYLSHSQRLGLKEVREELHGLRIPFHLLLGEAKTLVPSFVKEHNIGGVITDFSPLRTPLSWVNKVGEKLPEGIPLCQVSLLLDIAN